jgi:hypothetical protein
LLAFTTVSSPVPLGGFATFRAAGRPMTTNCEGEKAWFATAHTCENRSGLVKCENEDETNENLLCAIENCGGFGMR